LSRRFASTRDEIVEAAIAEFAEKGFYSAHMEAIAGRAGVNKAMVYYYFGSKEKLLSEVLAVIFQRISEDMRKRFVPSQRRSPNPVDRIRLFVESHFDVFTLHQNYARILVNILAIYPDKIKSLFASHPAVNDIFTGVYQTLEEGRRQGLLRDIDYRQLLISILGMNLVYFVTKPVAQVFLQVEIADEAKFIQERRKFIVDLLLNGIIKKPLPTTEVS
jgi:TetR/AcrR family transcriptional regulator